MEMTTFKRMKQVETNTLIPVSPFQYFVVCVGIVTEYGCNDATRPHHVAFGRPLMRPGARHCRLKRIIPAAKPCSARTIMARSRDVEEEEEDR